MEREKRIRNLRKLDDCASTSLSLSLARSRSISLFLSLAHSLVLARSRSISLEQRSLSTRLCLARSEPGASNGTCNWPIIRARCFDLAFNPRLFN